MKQHKKRTNFQVTKVQEELENVKVIESKFKVVVTKIFPNLKIQLPRNKERSKITKEILFNKIYPKIGYNMAA